MDGVRQWFVEGGYFMYLLLALGVPVALIGGVMHAVAARRWSLLVALLLLLVPAACGALGTVLGRRTTDDALRGVDPAHHAMLRETGYREAGHSVRFGVGISVVGLVPFVIGEGRRLRRE